MRPGPPVASGQLQELGSHPCVNDQGWETAKGIFMGHVPPIGGGTVSAPTVAANQAKPGPLQRYQTIPRDRRVPGEERPVRPVDRRLLPAVRRSERAGLSGVRHGDPIRRLEALEGG
jgi:hypothetical protein